MIGVLDFWTWTSTQVEATPYAGKYREDWAGARTGLLEAGRTKTFIYQTAATHDPEAGTFGSVTASTYSGEAVQVSGNADEYDRLAALGTTREQAVVLLWTPSTYGEQSLPPLGSTITWGGRTLTLVAILKDVAPDGVTIVARLGCRR